MFELNYDNIDEEFLDLYLIDLEIDLLIELIRVNTLCNKVKNLNKELSD